MPPPEQQIAQSPVICGAGGAGFAVAAASRGLADAGPAPGLTPGGPFPVCHVFIGRGKR